MDIINFTQNLLSDPYSWLAFLVFFMGYTYTTKVDDSTAAVAEHINTLQIEKLDRDGEVPATGTIQWDKGANVASTAALPVLADGNYFDVTGTTTITSIDKTQSQPGTIIKLHFDAILRIEHDGDNIILPDGKDIYTMAGTELEFTEYSAGKWRCTGYLRGVPVLTNFLRNSGFGYWPQSDTNKGLATITYDSGNKQAGTVPSVGDAVVGGTSGAVGKVISYTTLTGDWDTGDATGVVTIGAVSHDFAFIDNETITFGGVETAIINMPDSAVQVGLVQNGGFAAATTGWDVLNSATLSSAVGGEVGNCLKVLENGADNPGAKQSGISVTGGKIYKLSFRHKDIDGTSDDPAWYIYDNDAVAFIKALTVETANAAWTPVTFTFKAPDDSTDVEIGLRHRAGNGDADAYYFDEVTLYEITPCCTGADAVAFDKWIKDPTIDIYREHNGSNTKDGSFYALKMVPTVIDDYVRWPGTLHNLEYHYMKYRSKPIAVGVFIKTSTASHAFLRIHDGSTNDSGYHSGGGDFEWIELPLTVSATNDRLNIQVIAHASPNVDGSTIVYVSQPIFVFGSQIGEGNYQPMQNEMIWGAKPIPSNTYDGLLNQSDLAYTDLNLEADSDSMLPKGAKVIAIQTDIEDSGSGAGLDVHLELRKDATATTFFINSVAGKPNDIHNHLAGLQPCDENGDIDIHLDASGANTLDINTFEYRGVQVS